VGGGGGGGGVGGGGGGGGGWGVGRGGWGGGGYFSLIYDPVLLLKRSDSNNMFRIPKSELDAFHLSILFCIVKSCDGEILYSLDEGEQKLGILTSSR